MRKTAEDLFRAEKKVFDQYKESVQEDFFVYASNPQARSATLNAYHGQLHSQMKTYEMLKMFLPSVAATGCIREGEKARLKKQLRILQSRTKYLDPEMLITGMKNELKTYVELAIAEKEDDAKYVFGMVSQA